MSQEPPVEPQPEAAQREGRWAQPIEGQGGPGEDAATARPDQAAAPVTEGPGPGGAPAAGAAPGAGGAPASVPAGPTAGVEPQSVPADRASDAGLLAAARRLATGRAGGCLLEVIETLVLTLVIFFVIQTFVAQPYQIKQQSMEHTLEPDQYVLVDKLTPRFDDYKRGDIVVFNPPPEWQAEDPGTPFIKRVIGLPGDTVDIHDNAVYVNGHALDEPYLYESQPTLPTTGVSHWVVPQGALFVMGDHRVESQDSRTFGPIDRSAVIGRAWLRYWPPGQFGILPTPRYAALSSSSP